MAAAVTAGSIAWAHTRYPSADGWYPSWQYVPASARNTAPVCSARSTGTPSAARTACAWAWASRRPCHPTSWRSGGANARAAPRSGQVPTTTFTPAERSRRTAAPRYSAASATLPKWIASLPPIRTSATSGRGPTSARATCVPRSDDRDPDTATLDSSTRRTPAASASSWASWPPTVSMTWSTPTPSAVESPSSTRRRIGAPAVPTEERMASRRSGVAYRRARASIACPASTAAPPTVPAIAVIAAARPSRRTAPRTTGSPLVQHRFLAQEYVRGPGRTFGAPPHPVPELGEPAGPSGEPGTADLGTGPVGRLGRGVRQAAHALAESEPSGFLDRTQRRDHGGQYRGGGRRVPGRGRVEPVGAEHAVRLRVELRTQQVAQRDGTPARRHDRDGLRGGELAAPPPGHPAQRRLDRPDRAQVRAGAHDHLGAGRAQFADGVHQVPDRLGDAAPVRDVVAAHDQYRHVGVYRHGPFHLRRQVTRLGADDREAAQCD